MIDLNVCDVFNSITKKVTVASLSTPLLSVVSSVTLDNISYVCVLVFIVVGRRRGGERVEVCVGERNNDDRFSVN